MLVLQNTTRGDSFQAPRPLFVWNGSCREGGTSGHCESCRSRSAVSAATRFLSSSSSSAWGSRESSLRAGPTSASVASSAQSAGSSLPEACLWFFARPARSEAFVLVARAEGRVVGCSTILGRSEPSVTGAAALPQFRGRGVAFSQLQEAVRRLRLRGHRRASAAAVNDAGRRSAAPCPRSRARPWARSVPSLFPAASERSSGAWPAGAAGSPRSKGKRPTSPSR